MMSCIPRAHPLEGSTASQHSGLACLPPAHSSHRDASLSSHPTIMAHLCRRGLWPAQSHLREQPWGGGYTWLLWLHL